MLFGSAIKVRECESLDQIIGSMEMYPEGTSLGADIDAVHRTMLDSGADEEACYSAFMAWMARYQPCLFGRLGARGTKGVSYDVCWITTEDIRAGDLHVSDKIQRARRAWKDRAADGLCSGFLIMFHDPRLTRVKPGPRLLEACRRACELYVVENAPLQSDTIYTEAIPLRMQGGYGVFKGGINVFYPTAHRTLNHDRRVPGGIVISVNSPGHLANSMVAKGLMPSLPEAIQWIYDVAMHSIGNGGIGHDGRPSSSWHNTVSEPGDLASRCPMSHRPAHVPENYSGRLYSATCHTDVLLPTYVTVKEELDPDITKHETWPWLIIDYISDRETPPDHINYGFFHPHPILPEARYHNPWPPRAAHNAPMFTY
jgi:hypothetical protein